jgi:hypothetical protein
MRALVVVPHFFNHGGYIPSHFGSHQVGNLENRRMTLNRSKSSVIEEFKRMDIECDLFYFGIADAGILDLQIETTASDPRFLPWLAIDHAYSQIEKYDLITVIEDDIEFATGTLSNLIAFNTQDSLNVTLIPNRIENFKGNVYCTDLISMPGWKGSKFEFLGLSVREPINIHSGLVLLSAERFKTAYESRPFKLPTRIIGDYMASAFANIHAFQKVVRAVPVTESVTVLHRDNWVERMIELSVFSEADFYKRILSNEIG